MKFIILISSFLLISFSCKLFHSPWGSTKYDVGIITKVEQDRDVPLTHISYKYYIGEKEVHISRGVSNNILLLHFPEGANFEIKYNPENPERQRCIYFYKPVYNANSIFGKTKAKIFYVAKSYYAKGCGYLGGLVLNYEYYVNGKKYLATSCFDLEKVKHLFGDKMRHLRKGFKNNYFDVKYDLNNPALSRLVLDGVEE